MHKVEKWFTTGLLISRQRKNLLAKNAFKNPSTENCELYKKFRNMYNTVIRLSKKLFFEQELKKHQSNLKVTWDILKKAIRKSAANKNVISSIKINGEVISDAKLIANNFNVFLHLLRIQSLKRFTPLYGLQNTKLKTTNQNSHVRAHPLQLQNSKMLLVP